MDLGVLLESPQGSQSLSRVGACTCAFLPSCSSSVTGPFGGSRDLWLSLEAFPRGFPTGLSHVPPWCESILGLRVEAVQGNRFPWNGLRHLADSGNGGKTLEFLLPFLWLRLLLRCDWNAGNSFRITQGKDPSSRAMRRKRAPLAVGKTLVLPFEWRGVFRGTS